jgi:molecular chaperone GrpE
MANTMSSDEEKILTGQDEPGAETGSGQPASDNSGEADPQEGGIPGSENPGPDALEISSGEWEEIQAKARKADENWDRFLRLTADFDNFKKRAVRDRQEAIRYANAALLEKLAPVLDNFDMAMSAVNNPQADSADALRTGVEMIYNQLKSVLEESGLQEINALHQPFDPNWHEAVSQMETDELPEGHVAQQLRKGYKLRDRLLRPATVVVAKKPAS